MFWGHLRSDDYLSEFCDGSLFESHTLFQAFPDALQLIIYFDELEVCNPLGSHSGIHKLGKEACYIPNTFVCKQSGVDNPMLNNNI